MRLFTQYQNNALRYSDKLLQSDLLHIRRHLAATPLFKGITDFKQTRIAMLRAETVNELFEIMNNIPKKYGISE